MDAIACYPVNAGECEIGGCLDGMTVEGSIDRGAADAEQLEKFGTEVVTRTALPNRDIRTAVGNESRMITCPQRLERGPSIDNIVIEARRAGCSGAGRGEAAAPS